MKREFILAEKNGEILIDNSFETVKGKYQIVIRRHRSDIYLFKYRDSKLLECQNLSCTKAKEVKENGSIT